MRNGKNNLVPGDKLQKKLFGAKWELWKQIISQSKSQATSLEQLGVLINNFLHVQGNRLRCVIRFDRDLYKCKTAD